MKIATYRIGERMLMCPYPESIKKTAINMDLQSQERTLLYTTYLKIAAAGSELTGLFYKRLFELNPSFQPLFNVSMIDQGIKWRMMLNIIIAAIDHPSRLKASLRDLGRRHAGYGVRTEDYLPFTEAVLWAIKQYLGPEFTAEVEAAWKKLFDFITEQATNI
jgi:hemoglobin-like flavoprotein